MVTARLASAVVIVASVVPLFPLRAQVGPAALAGRHHLTLTAGLCGTSRASTSVGVGGVAVESGASGQMGGLGYSYWLDDRLAAGVRALAVDVSADVSVTGSGTRVAGGAVVAGLLGVRYQFARLAASNTLRPYVAVWAGPLVGSADDVTAGTATGVTTVRQTVVSGLVSMGADVSLGRRLTLGAEVGYLLAPDFDQPIGARTNYSSPVFSLSLGVLFGGARAALQP